MRAELLLTADAVSFTLDGQPVTLTPGDVSAPLTLLDALRDHLGVRSVKDGCSPQGQCGCCTVLVDGQPRVACVTPVARVADRAVTSIDGLGDAEGWADCFARHGASQCGFCTPGIIVRASALTDEQRHDRAAVERALLAHLCRCTGWQTIVDAIGAFHDAAGEGAGATRLYAAGGGAGAPAVPNRDFTTERRDPGTDLIAVSENAGATRVSAAGEGAGAPADGRPAARRAMLEGGVSQDVGAHVAAGGGGFADDLAPADALVAVLGADGDWVVGETVAESRRLAGKVQGRRSTAPLAWPVDVPDGAWVRTLQTTWVEPAYVEPDASWCAPGGVPASPLGNGGAFGGKAGSEVGRVARRLADRYGRPVRVLYSREDVVRRGPKRPPMAIALDAGGAGVVRIGHAGEEDPALCVAAALDGIAAGGLAPDRIDVDVVAVTGPPTSVAVRAAVWAEIVVVASSLAAPVGGTVEVGAPNGAAAAARVDDDGGVHVTVRCGPALDETVLRSYCTGAAHMALGWVRSEGLALDGAGVPVDLTIRSFGVLRAVDTPPIHIAFDDGDDDPVNGSDSVFAAVAAAAWRAGGFPPRWPIGAG